MPLRNRSFYLVSTLPAITNKEEQPEYNLRVKTQGK